MWSEAGLDGPGGSLPAQDVLKAAASQLLAVSLQAPMAGIVSPAERCPELRFQALLLRTLVREQCYSESEDNTHILFSAPLEM